MTTLMTPNHHHIHMVGRYRQNQHADMTSRSQGQSQGHEGHFRFLPFFYKKSITSYSFDGRVLKMHRYVLSVHTQKIQEAEF